jgi:ABC-type cobalamin transport system ATPase subunit
VGHADIRLKLDGVIQTPLDEIGSSQRMLHDRDAPSLDIALRHAHTLVLHTELCEQTGLDISLEEARINVDISHQHTTFKERVTHTVCSY